MPAFVVTFWIAAALYAAASFAYMRLLVATAPDKGGSARVLLPLAFVGHMAEIGARGIAGMHPVSSAGDAVGFGAWIMVGAFLVAQWRRRLDAVGAFVAPAALVLLIVAFLTPDAEAGATQGLGALGRIHIGLATVGVSTFALATGLAIFYLVQERQLKAKKLGQAVRRGSPLETLDAMMHRAVLVGFPIFTVAMVTGAMFNARRGSGFRPEYPVAALAWSAFAALLIARQTAGWRGRRAARLTIAGFLATLVVLGIYVARRVGMG